MKKPKLKAIVNCKSVKKRAIKNSLPKGFYVYWKFPKAYGSHIQFVVRINGHQWTLTDGMEALGRYCYEMHPYDERKERALKKSLKPEIERIMKEYSWGLPKDQGVWCRTKMWGSTKTRYKILPYGVSFSTWAMRFNVCVVDHGKKVYNNTFKHVWDACVAYADAKVAAGHWTARQRAEYLKVNGQWKQPKVYNYIPKVKCTRRKFYACKIGDKIFFGTQTKAFGKVKSYKVGK